ncbi:alpha/beta hydrolase family protein [Deinococcus sonorensis]|uniref:Prolyl oligopeptidase family serine peptidase n=2 Tax=Deinococcus sonorensis TaxID=309891 RepID=A0AAU7U5L6_9DEIO
MFQYFPGNYVWNLAINLAMEMGAKIGELDEMCRPLMEVSQQGDDEGTRLFLQSWERMGDNLIALAHEDEAQGRLISAGTKLGRAATYLLTAERMQARDAPGRAALYAKFQDCFQRGVQLAHENCERVEIPYEGAHLAGLYTRAEGVTGKAPLLIQINGLDSTKEMLYRVGLPQHLARRGIASLCLDQPGTGEALRLHGLTARYDAEAWASRVVDAMETRADIDPQRIGLQGVSLGGYYAPRAVAFEPRFALGAVWGANHNWGEVQLARLNREGERPVPHYWEHVQWVWGTSSMDAFLERMKYVTLDGVLDRVRVPFLVTHGEQDRQIPLKYAHQTYDGLVNSPDKTLKIFTDREGGVQHSSVDNSAYALDYIADWVAERLGGRTRWPDAHPEDTGIPSA